MTEDEFNAELNKASSRAPSDPSAQQLFNSNQGQMTEEEFTSLAGDSLSNAISRSQEGVDPRFVDVNEYVRSSAGLDSQGEEKPSRSFNQLSSSEVEKMNSLISQSAGLSPNYNNSPEFNDIGSEVNKMPGVGIDYAETLSQGAIRGMLSVLDVGPMAWNALSWANNKMGGVQTTSIEYPSEIIGELTGLGSRNTNEINFGTLDAAAAQTIRDVASSKVVKDVKGSIIEALGGEAAPEGEKDVRPLRKGLFGDEIKAEDLSFSDNPLTAEQRQSIAPFEFGLEIASAATTGAGLMAFGGMRSLESARQFLPIAQKAGINPFFAEGRLIPRSLDDLKQLKAPAPAVPTRTGASKAAVIAASKEGIKAEAKFAALSSLSATSVGLATNGDPLAMTIASLLVPTSFAAYKGIKDFRTRKQDEVLKVVGRQGQEFMALENILLHSSDRDAVIAKVQEWSASGQKFPGTLGALTGDKGLLAWEKGRKAQGFNAEMRDMDRDALEFLSNSLSEIQKNGSEESLNKWLQMRVAAEESDAEMMLDNARQTTEDILEAKGTKYESLEKANLAQEIQTEAILANMEEKHQALWSQVPDEDLVNVSEVYRSFKGTMDSILDTKAAKEVGSKGYAVELNVLKSLAGISDDASAPIGSSTPSLMSQLIKSNAVKLTRKEANEYGYENSGWYYIDPDTNNPMGTSHATKKDLVADIENSPFDYGIDIKSTSEAVGPVEDIFVPAKELIDLRSIINAKTRELRSPGKAELNKFNANFASRFQEDLLNGILSAPNVSPAYKEAANYTRLLKQTTEKTAKNLALDDAATTDQRILKANERGAKPADEIISQAKFANQQGVEGAQDLLQATEEVGISSFASAAISPEGVVNTKAANAWIKKHASFLRRFPNARARMEKIADTGDAEDLAQESAKLTRSSREKSVAVNLIQSPNAIDTIDKLLAGKLKGGFQKGVDDLLEDISQTQDPAESLRGLQVLILDRLSHNMTFASKNYRVKVDPLLKQVFGDQAYNNIKQIYDDVDKVIARKSVGMTRDEYKQDLLKTTIGKVLGARIGSQFGQSPLIMANVGGRVMERLLTKIPGEQIDEITNAMLLNPQEFIDYVNKVDKIDNVNEAVSMLHQWMLIAGVQGQMYRTGSKEVEERRPENLEERMRAQ